MLPEKLIIKISLIVIMFGLSGLYAITILIEPAFVDIRQIDENFNGKVVMTNGTISDVFLSDSKTLFLNLEENEDLAIIMFNVDENNLTESDKVVVRGEVTLYKGKLEIIAKKIEKQEN